MIKRPLFNMYEPTREYMIKCQKFYIQQAKNRLLSQFNDIEGEAIKYRDECLEKSNRYFGPDDDAGSFCDDAENKGITHYAMLDDMLKRTRLSIVAGMFHEWDKQFRDWMVKESSLQQHTQKYNKFIWNSSFKNIIKFLEKRDWPITEKNYYASLDKCRLFVNVYKHGNGDAFDEIKANYKESIETFGGDKYRSLGLQYANYKNLIIKEENIDEFSNAIISFWKDVPEYIYDKK